MSKLITKPNSIFNIVDDFFNDDFFGKHLAKIPSSMQGNSAIERISDNEYIIKINVAGFKKEDIEITQSNGYIHIRGEIRNNEQSGSKNNYVYNNFASSFSNSFNISEDIDYIDASIVDGVLNIHVVEKVNPNHTPKKINIR
jgi:HSP20 family molecular chaperone IbpA